MTHSSTWLELGAVFNEHHGERPDEPFKTVEADAIPLERNRLAALAGPGDEERLLMALGLYYRFMASGIEVFDNTRLLAEGMPPPPRFTDYLRLCLTTSAGRSLYEQMMDDD